MAVDLGRWKPELHPRDSKGRFRDAWGLSPRAMAAVDRLLASFSPPPLRSDQHAASFLRGQKGPRSVRQKAALQRFLNREGNENIQSTLRAGDEPTSDIRELDGMMRPLQHDLIVSRVLGPDAFGLSPEQMDGVEEWTGKLAQDLGYAPTNVGNAYPIAGPHVEMRILVPRGTRAIVVGDDGGPTEARSVILDRETPLRFGKIQKDERGGWYIMATVMPKQGAGRKEPARGLGRALTAREKSPAIEATPEEFQRRGLEPDTGVPGSEPQPGRHGPAGGGGTGERTLPQQPGQVESIPNPASSGTGQSAQQIQQAGGEVPTGAGHVTQPGEAPAAPVKKAGRASRQVVPEEQARAADEAKRAAAAQKELDARQARLEAAQKQLDAREARAAQREAAANDQLTKVVDTQSKLIDQLIGQQGQRGIETQGGTSIAGMTDAQKRSIMNRVNSGRITGEGPDDARILDLARQIREERAAKAVPAAPEAPAAPAKAARRGIKAAKATPEAVLAEANNPDSQLGDDDLRGQLRTLTKPQLTGVLNDMGISTPRKGRRATKEDLVDDITLARSRPTGARAKPAMRGGENVDTSLESRRARRGAQGQAPAPGRGGRVIEFPQPKKSTAEPTPEELQGLSSSEQYDLIRSRHVDGQPLPALAIREGDTVTDARGNSHTLARVEQDSPRVIGYDKNGKTVFEVAQDRRVPVRKAAGPEGGTRAAKKTAPEKRTNLIGQQVRRGGFKQLRSGDEVQVPARNGRPAQTKTVDFVDTDGTIHFTDDSKLSPEGSAVRVVSQGAMKPSIGELAKRERAADRRAAGLSTKELVQELDKGTLTKQQAERNLEKRLTQMRRLQAQMGENAPPELQPVVQGLEKVLGEVRGRKEPSGAAKVAEATKKIAALRKAESGVKTAAKKAAPSGRELLPNDEPDAGRVNAVRQAKSLAEINLLAQENGVRIPSTVGRREDRRAFLEKALRINPGESQDDYETRMDELKVPKPRGRGRPRKELAPRKMRRAVPAAEQAPAKKAAPKRAVKKAAPEAPAKKAVARKAPAKAPAKKAVVKAPAKAPVKAAPIKKAPAKTAAARREERLASFTPESMAKARPAERRALAAYAEEHRTALGPRMLAQVNNLDDRSAEAYWARRRDGASHTEAMTGLTRTKPVITRAAAKALPIREPAKKAAPIKKVAAPRQTAADKAQSARIASEFHEDWRKTRLRDDGSFEPRVKKTKDAAWIKAHGTDDVDIANTSYDDLPDDWKAENRAAAEVVQRILKRHGGNVDLNDEATRQDVGDEIHKAWLSRNDWAKGGDLDVPFADLPADEQAKDLDQVTVATRALAPTKAARAIKKAAPERPVIKRATKAAAPAAFRPLPAPAGRPGGRFKDTGSPLPEAKRAGLHPSPSRHGVGWYIDDADGHHIEAPFKSEAAAKRRAEDLAKGANVHEYVEPPLSAREQKRRETEAARQRGLRAVMESATAPAPAKKAVGLKKPAPAPAAEAAPERPVKITRAGQGAPPEVTQTGPKKFLARGEMTERDRSTLLRRVRAAKSQAEAEHILEETVNRTVMQEIAEQNPGVNIDTQQLTVGLRRDLAKKIRSVPDFRALRRAVPEGETPQKRAPRVVQPETPQADAAVRALLNRMPAQVRREVLDSMTPEQRQAVEKSLARQEERLSARRAARVAKKAAPEIQAPAKKARAVKTAVPEAAPEAPARRVLVKRAGKAVTAAEARRESALDAVHAAKFQGDEAGAYHNIERNVQSGDWTPARARMEAKDAAKFWRRRADRSMDNGRATPAERRRFRDQHNATAEKYERLAEALSSSQSKEEIDKRRFQEAPAAKKAARTVGKAAPARRPLTETQMRAEDRATVQSMRPYLDRAGLQESDLNDLDHMGLLTVGDQLRRGKISRREAARRLRNDREGSRLNEIAAAIEGAPRKRAAKAAVPTAAAAPERNAKAEAEKAGIRQTIKEINRTKSSGTRRRSLQDRLQGLENADHAEEVAPQDLTSAQKKRWAQTYRGTVRDGYGDEAAQRAANGRIVQESVAAKKAAPAAKVARKATKAAAPVTAEGPQLRHRAPAEQRDLEKDLTPEDITQINDLSDESAAKYWRARARGVGHETAWRSVPKGSSIEELRRPSQAPGPEGTRPQGSPAAIEALRQPSLQFQQPRETGTGRMPEEEKVAIVRRAEAARRANPNFPITPEEQALDRQAREIEAARVKPSKGPKSQAETRGVTPKKVSERVAKTRDRRAKQYAESISRLLPQMPGQEGGLARSAREDLLKGEPASAVKQRLADRAQFHRDSAEILGRRADLDRLDRQHIAEHERLAALYDQAAGNAGKSVARIKGQHARGAKVPVVDLEDGDVAVLDGKRGIYRNPKPRTTFIEFPDGSQEKVQKSKLAGMVREKRLELLGGEHRPEKVEAPTKAARPTIKRAAASAAAAEPGNAVDRRRLVEANDTDGKIKARADELVRDEGKTSPAAWRQALDEAKQERGQPAKHAAKAAVARKAPAKKVAKKAPAKAAKRTTKAASMEAGAPERVPAPRKFRRTPAAEQRRLRREEIRNAPPSAEAEQLRQAEEQQQRQRGPSLRERAQERLRQVRAARTERQQRREAARNVPGQAPATILANDAEDRGIDTSHRDIRRAMRGDNNDPVSLRRRARTLEQMADNDRRRAEILDGGSEEPGRESQRLRADAAEKDRMASLMRERAAGPMRAMRRAAPPSGEEPAAPVKAAAKAVRKRTAPAAAHVGPLDERPDIKAVLDHLPESERSDAAKVLRGEEHGVANRRTSIASALRNHAAFLRQHHENRHRATPGHPAVAEDQRRGNAIADHYDRLADLVYPKPGTKPSLRKQLPEVEKTLDARLHEAGLSKGGHGPLQEALSKARAEGSNRDVISLQSRAADLRRQSVDLRKDALRRRRSEDPKTRKEAEEDLVASKELAKAADVFGEHARFVPKELADRQRELDQRRAGREKAREEARIARRKLAGAKGGIPEEQLDEFARNYRTPAQWKRDHPTAQEPARSFHVTESDRVKSLRERAEGGTTRIRRLGGGEAGGNVNDVALVRDKNGKPLIRKQLKQDAHLDPERQADAENLHSRFAEDTNVDAPATFQSAPDVVYQERVEGRLASSVSKARLQKLLESPEGRRIHLTDLIAGNPDRHDGNMIVGTDGKLHPFDHGMSFPDGFEETDAHGEMRPVPPSAHDPFRTLYPATTGTYTRGGKARDDYQWADEVPFTREEVQQARKALVAMRPEFTRAGRQEWYRGALGRADALLKRAKPESKKPVIKRAAKAAPAKAVAYKISQGTGLGADTTNYDSDLGRIVKFPPINPGEKTSYRAYKKDLGGKASFPTLKAAKDWLEGRDTTTKGEFEPGQPGFEAPSPAKVARPVIKRAAKKAVPEVAGARVGTKTSPELDAMQRRRELASRSIVRMERLQGDKPATKALERRRAEKEALDAQILAEKERLNPDGLERLQGRDLYALARANGVSDTLPPDMVRNDLRVKGVSAPESVKEALPEAPDTKTTPEPVKRAPSAAKHEIKLPDGTVATRTSRTRDYTHAVVVTKNNHKEADRLDRLAELHIEAKKALEEAVRTGDWSKFQRVSDGGNAYFTHHALLYKHPDSEKYQGKIKFRSFMPKDIEAEQKHWQATYDRFEAQGHASKDRPWYSRHDVTPDEYRRRQLKEELRQKDTGADSLRAEAKKLRAAPEEDHYVAQWSSSQANAMKAKNSLTPKTGEGIYRSQVVPVGTDMSGGKESVGERAGVARFGGAPQSELKRLGAKKAAATRAEEKAAEVPSGRREADAISAQLREAHKQRIMADRIERYATDHPDAGLNKLADQYRRGLITDDEAVSLMREADLKREAKVPEAKAPSKHADLEAKYLTPTQRRSYDKLSDKEKDVYWQVRGRGFRSSHANGMEAARHSTKIDKVIQDLDNADSYDDAYAQVRKLSDADLRSTLMRNTRRNASTSGGGNSYLSREQLETATVNGFVGQKARDKSMADRKERMARERAIHGLVDDYNNNKLSKKELADRLREINHPDANELADAMEKAHGEHNLTVDSRIKVGDRIVGTDGKEHVVADIKHEYGDRVFYDAEGKKVWHGPEGRSTLTLVSESDRAAAAKPERPTITRKGVASPRATTVEKNLLEAQTPEERFKIYDSMHDMTITQWRSLAKRLGVTGVPKDKQEARDLIEHRVQSGDLTIPKKNLRDQLRDADVGTPHADKGRIEASVGRAGDDPERLRQEAGNLEREGHTFRGLASMVEANRNDQPDRVQRLNEDADTYERAAKVFRRRADAIDRGRVARPAPSERGMPDVVPTTESKPRLDEPDKVRVAEYDKLTREEFDALPADRRKAILDDIRAIRDSKATTTIPSNRTSMGTTIRGATAPHVHKADALFQRFTREPGPLRPVRAKYSKVDNIDSLKPGDMVRDGVGSNAKVREVDHIAHDGPNDEPVVHWKDGSMPYRRAHGTTLYKQESAGTASKAAREAAAAKATGARAPELKRGENPGPRQTVEPAAARRALTGAKAVNDYEAAIHRGDKAAALQAWRADYIKEHGREPSPDELRIRKVLIHYDLKRNGPKREYTATVDVGPPPKEDVPFNDRYEGDNMRMHNDSSTYEIAKAYHNAGRNGSANRMIELRRRGSTGDEKSAITPQQLVDELVAIRAQEKDPKFQRMLENAIDENDAPHTPVPDLPANTPPEARRLIEDLNKIPRARKQEGEPTHGAGFVEGPSLVEQIAQVYRDAAAGQRDERNRDPASRVRDILRSKIHEMDDEAFRIWELTKRLDNEDLPTGPTGRKLSPLAHELREWEFGRIPMPDTTKGAAREVARQARDLSPEADVSRVNAARSRLEGREKNGRIERARGAMETASELLNTAYAFSRGDNPEGFKRAAAQRAKGPIFREGKLDKHADGIEALQKALGDQSSWDTPEKLDAKVRQVLGRMGITVDHRSGDSATFDPATMDTHAPGIKAGDRVQVTRPGLTYRDKDGSAHTLIKPQVTRWRDDGGGPFGGEPTSPTPSPRAMRRALPSVDVVTGEQGFDTSNMGPPEDTGPEGLPVKSFTLRGGYHVEHGSFFRVDGVPYLVEHPDTPDGRARAQRIQKAFEEHRATLPASQRKLQRSYAWVEGRDPDDEAFAAEHGFSADEMPAEAQSDNLGGVTLFARSSFGANHMTETLDHEFAHTLDHSEARFGRGSSSRRWAEAGRLDDEHRKGLTDVEFDEQLMQHSRIRLKPAKGTLPGVLEYPNGVTDYGTSSPGEDYSEAFKLWRAGPIGTAKIDGKKVPIWFRDVFPARAAIFDESMPEDGKAQLADIARVRGKAPAAQLREARKIRYETTVAQPHGRAVHAIGLPRKMRRTQLPPGEQAHSAKEAIVRGVPQAPSARPVSGPVPNRGSLRELIPNDTGPAGVPVRGLDFPADQYTIHEGHAWRFGNDVYVVEGTPQHARHELEGLRRQVESLPPELRRHNGGYIVMARTSPASIARARQLGIGEFSPYASTSSDRPDIRFWDRGAGNPLRGDSALPPILRHESAHNADFALARATLTPEQRAEMTASGSLGGISGTREWREAARLSTTGSTVRGFQQYDRGQGKLRPPPEPPQGKFPDGINDYATTNHNEDFGESAEFYFGTPEHGGAVGTGRLSPSGDRVPIWFRDLFPARAAVLDKYFPEFARQQLEEIRRLRG